MAKQHDWDETTAYLSLMEDKITALTRENANLRGILFDIFHEGQGLRIPTAIITRVVRALNKMQVR